MRKQFLTLAVLAVSLGLLAWPGATPAGIVEIVVEANDQDVFSPTTYNGGLPGTPNARWRWGDLVDNGTTEDQHNVAQDAGLFRSGDPTNNPGGTYDLQASAGTFLYHCEVHGDVGGVGMSGKIRIPPIQDGKSTIDQVPIRWAFEVSTTGSRYDVRYRRVEGPWKIWKNDTAKLAGVFGRNDNPVDYNPNRVYDISVRSERRNTSKHSNWSPPLSIIPPG